MLISVVIINKILDIQNIKVFYTFKIVFKFFFFN